MGAGTSELTCCARDMGLGSRLLRLEQVAAATPLHRNPNVSAGLLLWASELRLVLAGPARPSGQGQEQEEWGLEQPDNGSAASSSVNCKTASQVAAYDLWSAAAAWSAGTPVEELLCMAWLPRRRLLLCGGAGIKEVCALDDQQHVSWSLDSHIGKVRCLAWASERELALCAGGQEVVAFSVDGLAEQPGWEPLWLTNTEFLELFSLEWAASKELVFAGGSHNRAIQGKVAALGIQAGETRWTSMPPIGAVLCLVWAEEHNLLFCGGNHAKVAALEPEKGDMVWSTDPGVGESRHFGVYVDPGVTCLAWARASGLLICGGGAGRVAALDPTGGSLLWAVDPEVGALRSLAYVFEMGTTLCSGASGMVATLVT